MEATEIIKAIFTSYAYNRDLSDMIKLCEEVWDRIRGWPNINRTDDGAIIYGFIVLLYGEYDTSPRRGRLLDNTDVIIRCIDKLLEEYKILEAIENEQNQLITEQYDEKCNDPLYPPKYLTCDDITNITDIIYGS